MSMRSITRTMAILVGLVILAAACGRGDSVAGQHRLRAASPAEGAAPGGSRSALEVSAPDAARAEAAEQAAPAPGARSGTAAVPASPGTPAGALGSSGGGPANGAGRGKVPSGGKGATAQGERPATGDAAGGGETGPGDAAGAELGPSGLAGPGERTGLTDNEVVFGMHLPQSGPLGVLVGKAWHGADAYFRSVNAAGGIHGRKIRFVVADDGYSAQKAAAAIRDLVDTKKVFAASCLAGVDQCVVGLEYANAKGVPYIHAGMRESIVEQTPWAFPVTGSYPYFSEHLVDYLFTKRAYTNERKIAALHLNSANFDEAVERFQRRLARYGDKFAVKYPVEKDQSDFSAAITKMQNAGVDTVWLAVDPTLIAKFASQAKLLRFQPQYVFFLVGGDLTAQATGGNLDGAYGLSAVADPDWNGAGMARFRETFKRYYPDEKSDEFNVLAYLEAQAFVEGLRQAGPGLGRDAFARGMVAIDLLDSGISSPISYSRRSRATAGNGAMAVWEIHGTRTDQVSGFDF